MKKIIFLLGVIIGVLLVPAAVYFYFSAGFAPVATSAPPMPFEKMLANKAVHARMEKEMPAKAPFEASEANLMEGVEIYRLHCAVCHGLPGEPQNAIAEGMYPQPPHLFRGKGVTDDEPGESYWKAANGIRMTGMPGFGKTLSEKQLWEVSLLLAKANELPAPVKAALTKKELPPQP